ILKERLFRYSVALVDDSAPRNIKDYSFSKSTRFEVVISANKKAITHRAKLILRPQLVLKYNGRNKDNKCLLLKNTNHKIIFSLLFIKDYRAKDDRKRNKKELVALETLLFEEELSTCKTINDNEKIEETKENELIAIKSMRAVRRNLKNVDNYPLLLFVHSVEEQENNNVLEEPYDGVLTPNHEVIERIIQSYEEDNEIKEIYDILKENLSIPKSIHNYTKHYSIDDNLLYFSVVKGGNYRRINSH
ncbi:hypothetical protein BOH78_5082, partial [Pichia kudriavzevii]